MVKNLPANAGDVGSIPGSGLRKWQPAPVFLPGKFHGQRSLVGYIPWGCEESDTTKQLSTHKGVPRLTIMCIFFPPLFPTISTNKTAVYNESSLKFYQFRSFSN